MVPCASCRRSVALGVLGGDHDGAHRHRPVALVLDRDLRLAVGPEPLDARVAVEALPHRGQPLGDPVRQHDRQRHQLAGLVGGVAEHHALVAGALLLVRARVHAHGDVGRLPVDRGEHRAGPPVEAVGRVGVADALDRVPHEVGNVDVGAGGDLAGDHRHAGRDQGLAGDPARGVARQDGVEHRVGDLVGHLVGVAFGDRLGSEDVTLGHRP